jgi:hypothetical protein
MMMDLIENLNKSGGYSHLLVLQCVLSDFVIIVPLKSKTAAEITRGLLNSVFQQFNVEKLHSDNGPGFRHLPMLATMSALGVKIVASSSLHPAGRGKVERLVGIIKLLLKKFLATRQNLNWEYLPYLVSKILNNTISPKTGYKPAVMLYGSTGAGDLHMGLEAMAPPHHFVQSQLSHIQLISKEIETMTEIAKEKMMQLKLKTNERLNKNRTEKNFQPGDYVFVLDNSYVPGAGRVLRTKFSNSPYVVVKPLWTTTLVKRLADGFVTLYSNNDLKKYDNKSPLFADLPVEISKVLLHDFRDLLTSDFLTLTKLDSLEIPNSISLYDPDPENTLENTEDDSNTDTVQNEQNTWEQTKDETEYDEALRGMDKMQIGDEVENLDDDDIDGAVTLDSDSDDSDNDTPGQESRNLRNRTVTWDL